MSSLCLIGIVGLVGLLFCTVYLAGRINLEQEMYEE